MFEVKRIRICFAIIGDSYENLERELLGFGESHPSIHRIPFVDAANHSQWIVWKELTGKLPYDIGIGIGAAGCAIGHREAWKTFQKCDHEFLIVFEDDATFTSHGEKYFMSLLSDLPKLNLRLIHLGDHIKFNFRIFCSAFLKLDTREILRLIIERGLLSRLKPRFALNQFPFSGHAYIINRELADIALAETNIFLFPIDVLLNSISQVPRNLVARVRAPLIVQSGVRESRIKMRGR